jgi:hypothetical protein
LNRNSLALAGRKLLSRAVVPLLETLLPEPAEAAVLGTCCLGGSTKKFTPWAAVDPLSAHTLRFFSDPDFGERFDPGGKTFLTGQVLSWQYGVEPFRTAYPAVQVIDPTSGQPRNGVKVTVSLIQAADGGTATGLSGTLTVPTSESNEAVPYTANSAVFNDLKIAQAGTYRLRFTAEDLPGAPSIESGNFTVQDEIIIK